MCYNKQSINQSFLPSFIVVLLLFCLTACGGGAFEFSDFDNLGNKTPRNDNTKEPIAITKPPFISAISAGGSHSLAINSAGELYAWGYNYFRQLGDGTTTNKTSAVKICITTPEAWHELRFEGLE